MKKTLLTLLLLFSITFTFGQTTIGQQDFDSGTPILTYTNTGGTTVNGSGSFPNTPNYVSASTGFSINDETGTIEFSPVDASTYSNIDFSVRLASFAGTSGNGAENTDHVIISISTDGGTTYSEELEINGNSNAKWGFSGANAGTGVASIPYDGNNTTTTFAPAGGGYRPTDGYSYLSITNLPSSSNLRIKIEMQNNSNNEFWVIDDVLLEGDAPTGPTIVLNPTTLTGLDYTLGTGPSAEQTFTAEGFLLTSNLVLTAPTNFEISTTSGSGFGASISLTPTTGIVASTTIYTRLISGLAVNTYTGNITATSALAVNKTVALAGDVLAPLADVVITEVSYNSTGADDEWIEICNISGNLQDISNYTISDGGTLFTFPAATTIANNTCITVSLGSNGDGTFNNDCPFTPDYGINASTDDTNNLVNSSDTILLFAADGSSIIDSVTYDDADGADNNGATLHVIDATIDNSDTGTNWQEVVNGGSPGANALVSPCSVPELQLVDNSNTDQACGYTIAFGSQATGFNTDITFDIDNEGALDLNITSLVLSGAGATSFSIISPTTPFTIVAGNTQTVTVRFTPTSVGVNNAILTINNNDADEGTCAITLQGTGTTPEQEINVEGNIAAFPDIPNGDITPISLDNTLFAAQNIGASQTKSFRIQNIGTADLDITSITVGGLNPGDFTVSLNPTPFTVTAMQDPPGIFEITFSPIASGTRTAIISIANNDLDETPYTFTVQGNGLCNPGTITILPASGPKNTIVTVTGTNLTAATATVSGITATVNNISDTIIEVTIPTGATSGTIDITDDLGCPASSPFTVIDHSGSCGSATGLMITEVYDQSSGSLGYIEIFNGTATTIDLTQYEINRFGDLTSTGSTHTYTFPNTGTGSTITSNQILVGRVNSGGTGLEDFDFGGSASGFNDNDRLELTLIATGVIIDDFHDVVIGTAGYVYRRNTDVSNPNPTFDNAEWTTATSGETSHLGTFATLNNAPTITAHPQPINNCSDAIVFTAAATPGNSGTLTYQWYYNDTISSGWTSVLSASFAPGTVSGETSTILSITGANIQGYQFYCEVTEDGACSTASDAARVNIGTTTWTLGAWDNGIPSLTTQAILNDDYNTSAYGNIEACSLTINPSYFLTVSSNTYVKIQNNITNNGTLLINDSGSVVQINDSGTYDDSGSSATNPTTVERLTASISDWYEYTYWSSPVTNETIGNALFQADANRRFGFIAANFVDSTYETNNDNTTTVGAGIDDIDDNGDDWTLQPPGALMTPGVGYAATHSTAAFAGTNNYNYSFRGPLNNGVITVPVERNDTELGDSNWNLIGNPYPSAIDAKLFFDENTFSTNPATGTLDGAIHLWSHSTPPSSTANGNEILNFDLNDYIVINYTGSSVSGVTSHVASGQSFFTTFSDALPTTTGTVTFNNSMRVDGNNNQFFRASNQSAENKLWLKLTSDSGLKDNILIGYVNGATSGNDGDAYDAKANGSYTKSMTFYSLIPTVNRKFSIQGKAINDLDIDETIAIGFLNNLDTPTIYTFSIAELQGDFLTNNTVYLKDNLTSTTFNLSDNDYSFTSPVGEFNSRFEIVFKDNSLSIDQYNLTADNLLIIEDSNNNVTFKLPNKDVTLKTIKIYDALGRLIYNLKAQNTSDTFNLSNLSQAAYIAQVELSNGKIIRKKAVKK